MYICIASLMLTSMLGAFTIEDDGATLTVSENEQPVLVYRYEPGKRPIFVSERYSRAGYIHPLYGLDGEVITQDFPLDHFHHRGVFWAWPDTTLGEREVDVWALDGVRQVHAEWVEQEAAADQAVIALVSHWLFDDAPESPIVREDVRIVAHPASENARALDFELTFTNVADEELIIRGSGTDDKGYGGFCLRPDATRRPLTFTSALGEREADEDISDEPFPSPWVDVSFATEPGGDVVSGAAVFQHPGNPDYPHSGWILRHYGFLGQSWPHIKPYSMQPGDAITLRYRVFVHRGSAKEADVAAAFAEYSASAN